MHPRVLEVTERLIERSRATRQRYLAMIAAAADQGPQRGKLQCANFAHGVAGCSGADKQTLRLPDAANVAIVTAYNDMLSAHQPYEDYPQRIKAALHEVGSVGQVAGGVPAMCDGVTQGEPGMEIGIASRETIAMSTAVALSHNMFDAVLCLGVCDKIVPGLLIGALRFGHLPTVFVPAGPMPSGLSNKAKAEVRERYAEGKASRDELLASEMAAYHSPGTCTFYGTANTNQMLMEIMGLHLPGASFVNPNTPLRDALTREAAQQVVRLTRQGGQFLPLGEIIDERALINSVVALHATGGSTNHTLHLPAIAQAAGIQLTWQDMAELSEVVPTLAHVYPNGKADINHFHAAGGTAVLIRELLDAGLLHEDVATVAGRGLRRYTQEPFLDDERLVWREGAAASLDISILRPVAQPFSAEGGLSLLQGNLGRGVMKLSAVAPERHVIEAPARVFHDQQQLADAFQAGQLDCDFVAVVRFQGPRCNGMPELHKLTPFLGVLQDRGHKVALVTDGRMSGASGKVPAAIHICPEAFDGGPLAKVRDGDRIRIDGRNGELQVLVDAAEWEARELAAPPPAEIGCGRELFAFMRAAFSPAEQGASAFTASLSAFAMSLASLQMPLGVPGYQYETPALMAEALAQRVAEGLREAVQERGRALLVVSGGRSPVPFFECLARQELPWSKVQVSLADERWVPPSHADSNEALVRRHLLQGPAAQATMLGLYHPAESLEEAARLAEQSVAGLPAIDVLVLGMGDDGHTASLFPASANLPAALDPSCPQRVLAMQAPAAPHGRLSLTLPALTGAHLQLLAIQGPTKLATLELALQPGAAQELPIRALLRPPLEVHWSP